MIIDRKSRLERNKCVLGSVNSAAAAWVSLRQPSNRWGLFLTPRSWSADSFDIRIRLLLTPWFDRQLNLDIFHFCSPSIHLAKPMPIITRLFFAQSRLSLLALLAFSHQSLILSKSVTQRDKTLVSPSSNSDGLWRWIQYEISNLTQYKFLLLSFTSVPHCHSPNLEIDLAKINFAKCTVFYPEKVKTKMKDIMKMGMGASNYYTY